MLRLPALRASNMSASSRPLVEYVRRKSGLLRDSTRITVAPCSAKYRVAMGPAAPDPNSRMFVPAHGVWR